MHRGTLAAADDCWYRCPLSVCVQALSLSLSDVLSNLTALEIVDMSGSWVVNGSLFSSYAAWTNLTTFK